MFFSTISAWNILVFPISLLLILITTTSLFVAVVAAAAEEEMNSYNLRPGRDLLAPLPSTSTSTSIFLPDDGSSNSNSNSNSLIAANSWTTTTDESSSNGQDLSRIPEYSIDGQGLGQLLVGGEMTDRCQPQSNKNRRRTRRRQVCPPLFLKPTGQDTRQDSGQKNSGGIWPTKFWPDDLPTAEIPPRPNVKADLEKCHHEKYNTPVCDGGVDSSPNLASSTGEWTLPNCSPCTWSPFRSFDS